MLLIDYLRHMEALTPDDARHPLNVALCSIRQFSFGPQYQIELNNGKVYELLELDTLLDIMVGEFAHWERYYRPFPYVIGPRLAISPREDTRTIDLAGLRETLKLAVTTYNLTQSWDHVKELLDAYQ